jgi:hypothetical protein
VKVIQKGYKEEAEQFFAFSRVVAERDGEAKIVDGTGVTEWGKYLLSILTLSTYAEKGEEAALRRLPFLFLLDRDFFLKQEWVRNLIADWLSRGEQEKINRALFGPPHQQGKDPYKRVLEQQQRNIKIRAAVDMLKGDGWSETQAFRWVSENLEKFSVTERLTAGAIRKIYKHPKDPLLSLLCS